MSFGMVAAGVGAAASIKSLTSKSGGGGSSTASKEPWAEAAPWLKDNIKKGQDLQRRYEEQPFNPLQQTAYQNAFSDIDNYRQDFMPAMMQYASGLMGPGFKLPQSYAPGGQGAPAQGSPGLMTVSGQGQGGSGFSQTPEQAAVTGQWIAANADNPALIKQHAQRYGMSNADLLQAAQSVDPNMTTAQVEQYMGRRDPQYARPAFGLIDWNSAGMRGPVAPAPAPAPAAESDSEAQRRKREEEEAYWRYADATSAGSAM